MGTPSAFQRPSASRAARRRCTASSSAASRRTSTLALTLTLTLTLTRRGEEENTYAQNTTHCAATTHCATPHHAGTRRTSRRSGATCGSTCRPWRPRAAARHSSLSPQRSQASIGSAAAIVNAYANVACHVAAARQGMGSAAIRQGIGSAAIRRGLGSAAIVNVTVTVTVNVACHDSSSLRRSPGKRPPTAEWPHLTCMAFKRDAFPRYVALRYARTHSHTPGEQPSSSEWPMTRPLESFLDFYVSPTTHLVRPAHAPCTRALHTRPAHAPSPLLHPYGVLCLAHDATRARDYHPSAENTTHTAAPPPLPNPPEPTCARTHLHHLCAPSVIRATGIRKHLGGAVGRRCIYDVQALPLMRAVRRWVMRVVSPVLCCAKVPPPLNTIQSTL